MPRHLERLQEQAAQLGTVWQQAIAHVFKVIANYEPHLFFCYQIPDVLRTNNDLEQSFGQVRAHERGALPRLVVQGTARMRAAFATRLHVFTPGKLVPHDVQSWGQLCAQISIGRRLVANNGAFAKARLPIWPPMRLNSSRRVYNSRKIWRKVRSMLRRDFLKLARNASVFAAIAGSSGFGLPRQAKYATIDLDWVENYVVKLRAHFEQGNTYYVLEESLRCYNTLKRALIPESDARAAELQMRLGLLHAKAQDAALPWYERAHPAICTYNLVEEEILRKYPLKAFPFYRAYLLAQRAPLYREIGQLEKSVEQFTRALNTYVRESGDSALHVELYYSRAHAWVVQGNIQNWLRDLDAARAVAQAAEEEHRKQLLGLVTYTQGEGYKRLAYSDRLDLSAYQRAQYAAKGLECFEQTRFVSEKRWAAHALIHGVAEAQCLVRLEPNEAIRRCEVLRVQAQQAYPSIIQKIDRTIGAARQCLNRRRREVG